MNEFFRCVAEAKSTELKAGDRQVIALPGGLKMAFAYCPASATIEGFYTGVYPVTQAEYQAVIGSNPSYFQGNTLPVEQVSWEDAIAFCEKLKFPHPWGLADVHGNVWEWCTDWYNSEQNLRMLRGGSWTNSALMCRAAYRFAGMPTLRVLNCGVRVCYSVSQ